MYLVQLWSDILCSHLEFLPFLMVLHIWSQSVSVDVHMLVHLLDSTSFTENPHSSLLLIPLVLNYRRLCIKSLFNPIPSALKVPVESPLPPPTPSACSGHSLKVTFNKDECYTFFPKIHSQSFLPVFNANDATLLLFAPPFLFHGLGITTPKI